MVEQEKPVRDESYIILVDLFRHVIIELRESAFSVASKPGLLDILEPNAVVVAVAASSIPANYCAYGILRIRATSVRKVVLELAFLGPGGLVSVMVAKVPDIVPFAHALDPVGLSQHLRITDLESVG